MNVLAHELRKASNEYQALLKEADKAREERDGMIREAMLTGSLSVDEIMNATGLSRERLYQIRKLQDDLPRSVGQRPTTLKDSKAKLPWE